MICRCVFHLYLKTAELFFILNISVIFLCLLWSILTFSLIHIGVLSIYPVAFYKKAAALCYENAGKHSPQLAQAIVDCGALDTLVICLEDFDPWSQRGCSLGNLAILQDIMQVMTLIIK